MPPTEMTPDKFLEEVLAVFKEHDPNITPEKAIPAIKSLLVVNSHMQQTLQQKDQLVASYKQMLKNLASLL